MEREFAKMLMDALKGIEVSEAERAANERRREDTVKLNRMEFREVFRKMASIEASNTNEDHSETRIGRLCTLGILIGPGKYSGLMSMVGAILEEYLFGLPDGEPSEYRVKEDGE